MPFADYPSTTKPTPAAPTGYTILNPDELVRWAVATGRIAAADAATWLANIAGPGGTAYSDELLRRPGRRYGVRFCRAPSTTMAAHG